MCNFFLVIDFTGFQKIELITEDWAKHHPKVEPGDIMISVRNLNAIAIIDRATKTVKCLTNGPFAQQHDPDLLANGNILLFDNWGTTGSETGATRIIEWDPKAQEIVWEYINKLENNRVGAVIRAQRFSPDSLNFIDGVN